MARPDSWSATAGGDDDEEDETGGASLISGPHGNRAAQPKWSVMTAVIDVDRVFTFRVAVRDRNACEVARADVDQALPALRAIERQMSEAKSMLMDLHGLNSTDIELVCNR